MPRPSGSIFFVFVLCALPLVLNADTLDDAIGTQESQGEVCPKQATLVPLADERGSVGLMKNLAEHPESMRAVAEKLLKSAVDNTEFLAPSACTGECSENVKAEIVYVVQPIAFLPPEKQNQVCLDFEESTKSNPMQFGPKTFPSVEGLNTWISDFTRGNGDDGKKLYDACSSNCSPRYTFFIEKDGEQLTVTSDVLCGLARDKDEEFYQVATQIRQTCLSPGQ